jgi:hypothetical protein
MKVYVAGPYTKGDVAENVREAIRAGEIILMQGDYPFIPHLTHFWHLLYPHSWNYWMDYDKTWLKQCDAVVRLPGESVGADIEVTEAMKLGLKIYVGIEDYKRSA